MNSSIKKGWVMGAGIALILGAGILAAGWGTLHMPELLLAPSTPSLAGIASATSTPTAFPSPAAYGIPILPAPAVRSAAHSIAAGVPFDTLTEIARFGDGWPASAAFSPDGSRFALGTSIGVESYGTVNWKTAAAYDSLSPVFAVAYSPDGRWLAAGKQDGNIALLDPSTLKPISALLSRNTPVRSLAFSHSNSSTAAALLAAGYQDGTIAVWNLATLSVQLQVGDPFLGYWGYGIRSLAFSRDNAWLVAGGDQGYISSWLLSDGKAGDKLQSQHGLLFGLAFSPDGRKLASACSDGTVQIWNYLSGQPENKVSGHSYGAWSVAFSPDGTSLAVGAGDGRVHLWDIATSVDRQTASVSSGTIDTVAFSPDGSYLAAISAGKNATILNTTGLQTVTDFPTHLNALKAAGFSADKTQAVVMDETGIAYLWNLPGGKALAVGKPHKATNAGMYILFSPDDRWLAAADGGLNRLYIYPATGLENAREIEVDKVRALAFAPSGNLLAAAGLELASLNPDSGSIQRFPLTSAATSLTFLSPANGTLRLAVGTDSGAVELWDLSTGSHTELIPPGSDPVWALAGYENWLAVADNSGSVALWDSATGHLHLALHGNIMAVLSLAFSPDGSLLAAGGLDGTITIWNTADGVERAQLRGHNGWVSGLAFRADGTMLLSAGADGIARIWGIIGQ